jgi:peptide/nickel transport system permease protein
MQGFKILRKAGRNPTTLLGIVLTMVVLATVIVGPLVSPYDPAKMDFLNVLKSPSLVHPFGTDSYGRDVLTRVFYGAQVSLLVCILGVAIGAISGISFGMCSAYLGRGYDMTLMRFVDLLSAFPSFVLALLLMFALGTGAANVVAAIALCYLPSFARTSRNMTMAVKSEPFVEAAQLMGQGTPRILVMEILPNIAAALVVQASTAVAFAVILESGLSFLGLGIQPPTPTLGGIMADGKDYFRRAPWVLTCTGLSISVALLGLNLIGDGIRDLMDPKLRRTADV